MATDLTGLKVKDTYNSLLKIGDNSSLSATPDRISDGLGNESALWLSTARVGIGSTPDSNYTLTVSNNIKTQSLDASSLITASSLRLTGGSGTQGLMSWNTDEETIDITQNGAVLQVGQEIQVHVKNQTGSAIADGTPVYVTGTLGSSGRLTVAPMIADGTIEAKYFLGITTEDIPNGEDGKVTTFGKIRGLDTDSYNEGDTLYVSASTAGEFQTTAPVAPNLDLEVAIVIKKSTNQGTIFVRAQNGHYLGLLHDVYISSPANNQFLVYNSTNSRWENSNDLVVNGNLTVSGTTTFIDTTNLNIGDAVITLNADIDGVTAPTEDAGIEVKRGSSSNVSFLWDETNDRWTLGAEDLVADNFIGNVTGNVTGDVTGDLTGTVTVGSVLAIDSSRNADFVDVTAAKLISDLDDSTYIDLENGRLRIYVDSDVKFDTNLTYLTTLDIPTIEETLTAGNEASTDMISSERIIFTGDTKGIILKEGLDEYWGIYHTHTGDKFILRDIQDSADVISIPSGGAMTLTPANGEPVNITNNLIVSSRIGVGVTSPSTAIDVDGTVTATAFVGDGSGLTNVSTTSDLQDVTDNGATTTNSITVGGLSLADNDTINLGSGDDLEIYHNGSHSFIRQLGTGNLYIDQTVDDKSIVFRNDNGSGGLDNYYQINGSTEKNVFYKTVNISSGNLQIGGTTVIDSSRNITGVQTTSGTLRLTATDDASVASTAHAFQIGSSSSNNIIMDTNEIMARVNGAVSSLHLNPDGGDVTIHNNTTAGNVTIGGNQVLHAGNHTSYTDPKYLRSDTNDTMNGNLQLNGRLTIATAAVPFTFNETGNTGLGQWWRHVLDGGNMRFDVSLTGGSSFTTYASPLRMKTNGDVKLPYHVAIGSTTDPAYRLQVIDDSPTDGIVADFVNGTNAGGTTAAIKLSNNNSTACDVIIGANRVGANFGSDFFISLSDGTDGTNQERFRITEAGLVGINQSSPSYRFTVSDSNATYGVGGDSGGNVYHYSTSGEHRFRANGSTTQAFVINNSLVTTNKTAYFASSVGIGTTSPAVKLSVTGTIYASGGSAWNGGGTEGDKTDAGLIINEGNYIYTRDGSQYLRKLIGKATDDYINIGESGTSLIDGIRFYSGSGTGTAQFRWFYNTSEIMRLNNTGLGIGTTSPDYPMDVRGSSSGELILLRLQNNFDDNNAASNPITSMFLNSASNNAYLRCYGAPADTASKHRFDIGSTAGSSFLTFSPSGSERMRLDSSGRLGLGTTSPAHKLDVSGSAHVSGSIHVDRGSWITMYGNNNAHHAIGSRNASGNQADDIRINSYGAVYINLDSNSNNSSGADFKIGRHGGGTGTISSWLFKLDGENGAGTFSGDVIAFGSPSDISLKENIKPIEGALDKVKKLQGVTFDWKQNDDDILKIKEDYGFIAQEVQEVLPELVRENENGKLSLRDKGIISVLVEAMKEQQKQIDELKARLDGNTK